MKKRLTYVTVLAAAILAAGRSARAEVKVALIQYQVRDDHAVGVDGDQVETYVREAAAAGAGMIVAPETCFYRYKPWLEAGVTIADLAAQYDALTARFSALADELDICLVMGLREPYTDTHVYNTAVFFGPDGALLGDYHKVLPSSSELAWTQPGNAQLGFPTPYGRCGMLICKDLRVESIVARYDTQAIDLLVVVAADNDGSTFPYLAPACARAGYHAVLCNQVVNHGAGKGNSAVAYPDGSVSYFGGGEGVFYATLPLDTAAWQQVGVPVQVLPNGPRPPSTTVAFAWQPAEHAVDHELWVGKDDVGFFNEWVSGTNRTLSGFESGWHTWWIRGRTPDIDGLWVGPRYFYVPPMVPGAVTHLVPADGTELAGRRPELAWSEADPGATWYQLWINRDGVTYHSQWLDRTRTWRSATDLPAGEYRWWVQTWNSDGYGPWSDGAVFSIPSRVPGQGIANSPRGSLDSVPTAYAWEADPRATWYQLWVDRESSTHFSRWVKGESEYAPSEAHPFGAYKWWVRGWSPDGYGAWSEASSFAYGLVETLAPTGTLAVPAQPEFEWTGASDATWYLLSVWRDGGLHSSTWIPAGESYVPGDPLPYGRYEWRVRGWNALGYGPSSQAALFRCGEAVPRAGGAERIEWDDRGSADAEWYRLWISRAGTEHADFWVRSSETVPDGDLRHVNLDDPLPPGTYTCWIQAWQAAAGYGPWSAGLGFSVP